MIQLFARLAQPALLALEPELAHSLTLSALALAPLPRAAPDPACLKVEAFGLSFANPLGMAAGFDKNAEVPDALLRLGFGFAECGTITPLPQQGNPRPRVFRLAEDVALINRLGFNNEGHSAALARLAARKHKAAGPVGINVGANKDASDRAADYVAGVTAFAGHADYLTINISSPNTPGLRDLQRRGALDDLLARVLGARDAAVTKSGRKPVLLKIAPDVSLAELDDIVAVARARAIDGMIVSNTTLSRPAGLRTQAVAGEQGGLSGKPLFALSTQMLAQTFLRVERQFPLIGVGGIASADDAFDKIAAGASLVQLYSALVFRGAGLVSEIKRGLAARLAAEAITGVGALTGRDAGEWAAKAGSR